MKIFILEDDETLNFTLCHYFEKKGYSVASHQSLKTALETVLNADLYLVDISLPDGTGFEFAEHLSKKSDAPLIFLTVHSDQDYVISGFESGGDDYLTKPFSFSELDKRIEALFKRRLPKVYQLGGLCLDPDAALVTFDGEEIFLSVQDYRLLLVLLQQKEQVVDRSALNQSLNIDKSIQDNTLNVAIGRLRKKLEGMVVIETVIKQGYRLKGL